MNYTTSKDYEELWRLAREGKEVICKIIITDAYNTDGIIFTRLKTIGETLVIIEDREHNYLQASNKKDFIERCTISDIEFLPPDAWIKIESDKDLPPIGELVLGVEDGKWLCCVEWDTDARIWYCGDTYKDENSITHWKPLPKAPEVQS